MVLSASQIQNLVFSLIICLCYIAYYSCCYLRPETSELTFGMEFEH